CMETRLDHRRSACSNFINKVRSRPGIELSDIHPYILRNAAIGKKTAQLYLVEEDEYSAWN
ncbi:hypothetical protein, partial [Aeromonas sp. QDB04]|uniref:hypothetical protein n=1 Tax=Aeromonas sp. QDB04 TaxID=2990477 RepID=UPI0022E6F73A